MDNVGLLHILIFPPFIAAIVLAKKWGGGSDDDDGQDRIDRHAPKWMKLLCGVCFAYAFINFILCMVLNASGGPEIDKEGKYVIKSHGRVIQGQDNNRLYRDGVRCGRKNEFKLRLPKGEYNLDFGFDPFGGKNAVVEIPIGKKLQTCETPIQTQNTKAEVRH